MNIGDLVCRKSYNKDIRFIIKSVKENTAILSGIDYRLIADAKLNDLVPVKTRFNNSSESTEEESCDSEDYPLEEYTGFRASKFTTNSNEEITTISVNESIYSNTKCGLILHIDGDKSYLSDCLSYYKKLGVYATGVNISEDKQPSMILELLQRFNPNIVVITGHDSLRRKFKYSADLDNYKNSRYFAESIRIARSYNKNYDDLIIIAGGCKSHYEELMKAGSNFASSPNRTLLNVIDPVYVACKFATTSIHTFLDIDDISKDLLSISGSIGGIETRGQCRKAKPNY